MDRSPRDPGSPGLLDLPMPKQAEYSFGPAPEFAGLGAEAP
ncbi:hypothetical protein [Streptomyces sp. MP131-18]|nr:hypothetical protein [Streptomyces sp. MP131-18]ONK10101.1 hypothetical protein STBA_08230 [Streptomyces sp. MP131-18]